MFYNLEQWRLNSVDKNELLGGAKFNVSISSCDVQGRTKEVKMKGRIAKKNIKRKSKKFKASRVSLKQIKTRIGN